MKLVIADTGALISLGLIGGINLIEKIFGNFYIANAVWEELQKYDNPEFDKNSMESLKNRVLKIKSKNYLSLIADYGESESIILYEELHADFLLIDDNKARIIAESLEVNCIGSIGLLIKAKQLGYLKDLQPLFLIWLNKKRFFSKNLLNNILRQVGEQPI